MLWDEYGRCGTGGQINPFPSLLKPRPGLYLGCEAAVPQFPPVQELGERRPGLPPAPSPHPRGAEPDPSLGSVASFLPPLHLY